eukprot:scaffold171285_cov47-Attheya_sp.AAC.2
MPNPARLLAIQKNAATFVRFQTHSFRLRPRKGVRLRDSSCVTQQIQSVHHPDPTQKKIPREKSSTQPKEKTCGTDAELQGMMLAGCVNLTDDGSQDRRQKRTKQRKAPPGN